MSEARISSITANYLNINRRTNKLFKINCSLFQSFFKERCKETDGNVKIYTCSLLHATCTTYEYFWVQKLLKVQCGLDGHATGVFLTVSHFQSFDDKCDSFNSNWSSSVLCFLQETRGLGKSRIQYRQYCLKSHVVKKKMYNLKREEHTGLDVTTSYFDFTTCQREILSYYIYLITSVTSYFQKL